jgi:hypothetical protein
MIPVENSTIVINIPHTTHLNMLLKLNSLILLIILKHIPPRTKENQLLFPLNINSSKKYEYPPKQVNHIFFVIIILHTKIVILFYPIFL